MSIRVPVFIIRKYVNATFSLMIASAGDRWYGVVISASFGVKMNLMYCGCVTNEKIVCRDVA